MTSDIPGDDRSGEGLNCMTEQYAMGGKATLGRGPALQLSLARHLGFPTLGDLLYLAHHSYATHVCKLPTVSTPVYYCLTVVMAVTMGT